MTKISYHHDRWCFRISAKGHAEYAESGQDIVCAGISVLMSELLLMVVEAKSKKEIRNVEYVAEAANVTISYRYSRLSYIYDMVNIVIKCLENLQDHYPEHIRIKRE